MNVYVIKDLYYEFVGECNWKEFLDMSIVFIVYFFVIIFYLLYGWENCE